MALYVCRIYKIIILIFIVGSLLMARLFHLQIIENDNLARQSISMRMQDVPIGVARGAIVDRNGLALTNTTQHFTLIVFPKQIKNISKVIKQLVELTNLKTDFWVAQLSEHEQPFKVELNITAETGQKINKLQIPGIVVVAELLRYGYPIAAHLTGYINSIDNEGVSGIEGLYNDVLRGKQPEYATVLVDAGQRLIPGLGYKRLRLGDEAGPINIVLTLDRNIQKKVEDIMDKHKVKGAVVVLNPATGEILAMASRPNFDANHIDDYLKQATAPLMNRALAPYQPGSVFKLVTAAAALESGIVQPDDKFFDHGYIDVNNLRFNAWDYEKGGRGILTFTEALAYSSNPIFIEVGLKLGAERLIFYAEKFGFGHKTNLNLSGENSGHLPTLAGIYPGEVANLSIGQGELEATPLQIASMVATIANDGIKVDPYLINKLTNCDGMVVKKNVQNYGTRILTKKTASQIQEMMLAVTRFGTGQAAYLEGVGSAGKTGSAETGRTTVKGQGISHAWFAGFAPLQNPRYVVTVFVEDGMSGGDIAAPIFAEILRGVLEN